MVRGEARVGLQLTWVQPQATQSQLKDVVTARPSQRCAATVILLEVRNPVKIMITYIPYSIDVVTSTNESILLDRFWITFISSAAVVSKFRAICATKLRSRHGCCDRDHWSFLSVQRLRWRRISQQAILLALSVKYCACVRWPDLARSESDQDPQKILDRSQIRIQSLVPSQSQLNYLYVRPSNVIMAY